MKTKLSLAALFLAVAVLAILSINVPPSKAVPPSAQKFAPGDAGYVVTAPHADLANEVLTTGLTTDLIASSSGKNLGSFAKPWTNIFGVLGRFTEIISNTLSADGTNQSISLEPSGTGKVIVGGNSLVLANLADDPAIADSQDGQVYFNTVLNEFRGFDGVSWKSLVPTPTLTPSPSPSPTPTPTPPVTTNVQVLVVAGGGGGAGGQFSGNVGGGGGAGGYQQNDSLTVFVGSYSITVGVGGAGGPSLGDGSAGSNSSFDSLLTSTGGGGGSDGGTSGNGGSGGGEVQGTPGTGIAGQGNDGGGGTSSGSDAGGGGGAGFAGSAGTSAPNRNGGAGGAGLASTISGASVVRGGGGGGGGYDNAGAGGSGGGGAGSTNGAGAAGTANTGGGGGGAGNANSAGGNGGSGVVIIRYVDADIDATGGIETTDGAHRIHTFNSSGTFTVINIPSPGPLPTPTPTPSSNSHSLDLESTSSQYLSISDVNQTGLKMSNSFSIEMWVKFESTPTSGNVMVLVAKQNSEIGTDFGYQFRIHNISGTLQLSTTLSSSAGNGSLYATNWTPSVGTWYHVAVTWDSSATKLKYYVDGTQLGADITTSESALYTGGTAPFTIGIGGNQTSEILDGKVDEVRVWNDVRTAAEIADNKNTQLTGDEANLQGYWKLNSDTGDASGNNNDLVPNGSPVFVTDKPF